jgi:hypothetical protein
MKKYLFVAALASFAAGAFGQGLVIFYNRSTSGTPSPVVQPVYNVDPNCTTCTKNGAPATSNPDPAPVGTQTYDGTLLEGSGFSAAIWGTLDTADTTDDAILADLSRDPLVIVPFRFAGTTDSLRGYWTSVIISVPGVPVDPNARGRFIVRAWDNQGGTLDTWATAVAAYQAGQTAGGESTMFTIAASLGDGTTANPTPTIAGFESFQLAFAPVPEPSTLATLTFAVVALVATPSGLIRRR